MLICLKIPCVCVCVCGGGWGGEESLRRVVLWVLLFSERLHDGF